MSKEQDVIKWWLSYSEEEAKRRKEEWLDEHNKSRLYNEVLDKLTEKEFNTVLHNTIKDIKFHMTDSFMHISKEERDTWNKVTYESLTNLASTESNGLMSKEDKKKLDDIHEGANNYTHPKYRPVTSYKFKKVDEYGHIYGSSEPDVLPVTVDSVDTLNGKPIEYFAKNNNQVFNNITVPDVDISTAKDNTAINYKTMKSYVLDGAIQVTNSNTNLDTRKLWYNTKDNKAYYYQSNTWKPFSIPDKPVTYNDNGIIDSSLLPLVGYPIGSVVTVYGNTIPQGCLLLDGSIISKADYPKLWDRVSRYYKIISDNEYNSLPYEHATTYFSLVASDSDKFRLPNLYNLHLRPTSETNKQGALQPNAKRANIYGTFPVTPFNGYSYPEDIALYNKYPIVKCEQKSSSTFSYGSPYYNEWGYMGYEYANKNRESLDNYYKPIINESSQGFSTRSVTVLYCIKAK